MTTSVRMLRLFAVAACVYVTGHTYPVVDAQVDSPEAEQSNVASRQPVTPNQGDPGLGAEDVDSVPLPSSEEKAIEEYDSVDTRSGHRSRTGRGRRRQRIRTEVINGHDPRTPSPSTAILLVATTALVSWILLTLFLRLRRRPLPEPPAEPQLAVTQKASEVAQNTEATRKAAKVTNKAAKATPKAAEVTPRDTDATKEAAQVTQRGAAEATRKAAAEATKEAAQVTQKGAAEATRKAAAEATKEAAQVTQRGAAEVTRKAAAEVTPKDTDATRLAAGATPKAAETTPKAAELGKSHEAPEARGRSESRLQRNLKTLARHWRGIALAAMLAAVPLPWAVPTVSWVVSTVPLLMDMMVQAQRTFSFGDLPLELLTALGITAAAITIITATAAAKKKKKANQKKREIDWNNTAEALVALTPTQDRNNLKLRVGQALQLLAEAEEQALEGRNGLKHVHSKQLRDYRIGCYATSLWMAAASRIARLSLPELQEEMRATVHLSELLRQLAAVQPVPNSDELALAEYPVRRGNMILPKANSEDLRDLIRLVSKVYVTLQK